MMMFDKDYDDNDEGDSEGYGTSFAQALDRSSELEPPGARSAVSFGLHLVLLERHPEGHLEPPRLQSAHSADLHSAHP
jgi:hypothetical protein